MQMRTERKRENTKGEHGYKCGENNNNNKVTTTAAAREEARLWTCASHNHLHLICSRCIRTQVKDTDS